MRYHKGAARRLRGASRAVDPLSLSARAKQSAQSSRRDGVVTNTRPQFVQALLRPTKTRRASDAGEATYSDMYRPRQAMRRFPRAHFEGVVSNPNDVLCFDGFANWSKDAKKPRPTPKKTE